MPKNMTGKQKGFFGAIAGGDIKKEGVPPEKAKSWLKESSETPADEAKESPAQQAKEKREGTEMHGSKKEEKCDCGQTMVDGKCPKCEGKKSPSYGLKKVQKAEAFKSKGIKV